jgi:hypothetical protein
MLGVQEKLRPITGDITSQLNRRAKKHIKEKLDEIKEEDVTIPNSKNIP